MARHAKFKFKFISRDLGYRKITEELKKIAEGGEAYVKVGLIGDKKDKHKAPGWGISPDKIDSVSLGIIHEFGAPAVGIPERSFLRRTVDQKRSDWYQLAQKLIGYIYEGKLTIVRALGILGAQAANDVKRTITTGEGVPPPNAPSVIAEKLGGTRTNRVSAEQKSQKFLRGLATGVGGVRTLVDTGRMLGSITWAVVFQGKDASGEGGGE